MTWRTIQSRLDAMSPRDGSLALALLKLDDEAYPLRRHLPLSQAREIAERRTEWPVSLIGFKTLVELRYYLAAGPKPPWIDRGPPRGGPPTGPAMLRKLQRKNADPMRRYRVRA